MSSQGEAIVIGKVAAALLLPVIIIVWRRLAPGRPAIQLAADAYRWNAALSTEALIAAFVALGIWGIGRGLASEVSRLEVATVMGMMFSVPYWWVLLRTKLRGAGALAEYAAYVETKDGISFRSLSVVAVIATIVAISCGVLSHVQT